VYPNNIKGKYVSLILISTFNIRPWKLNVLFFRNNCCCPFDQIIIIIIIIYEFKNHNFT